MFALYRLLQPVGRDTEKVLQPGHVACTTGVMVLPFGATNGGVNATTRVSRTLLLLLDDILDPGVSRAERKLLRRRHTFTVSGVPEAGVASRIAAGERRFLCPMPFVLLPMPEHAGLASPPARIAPVRHGRRLGSSRLGSFSSVARQTSKARRVASAPLRCAASGRVARRRADCAVRESQAGSCFKASANSFRAASGSPISCRARARLAGRPLGSGGSARPLSEPAAAASRHCPRSARALPREDDASAEAGLRWSASR